MEIITTKGNVLVKAKEIKRENSIISTYMVYQVVSKSETYNEGELLIIHPDEIILNTPKGSIFKEDDVLAVVKDVEV